MAIYNNRMYFGNRNRMTWVLAPKINYESSMTGWSTNAQYLNGGTFVQRSITGSKNYNFSWDLKPRDEIRAITDYAQNVYGTKPIYFLDPFAMDKNLLPQFWATPVLGVSDAPLLVGDYDSDRPDKIISPSNNLGYPYEAAVYNLDGVKRVAQIWLPCPPGYSLWFGAHGAQTGSAAVTIYPTTGPTSVGASLVVPMLLATDETRATTQVNGDSYTGALLTFTGVGSITLYGLIAQCLPNNVIPAGGGFISGQGHSGCSFASDPVLTNYSAAIDKVGATVNLVETEGWQ